MKFLHAAREAGVACLLLLLLSTTPLPKAQASLGDTDPQFRRYLDNCSVSGCLQSICISGCQVDAAAAGDSSSATEDAVEAAKARRVTDPWFLKAAEWDCHSECKYQSMVLREKEREAASLGPVKYFGKWPFTRVLGLQEPASVAFSLLNLLATLWGLASFYVTVYHRLPKKAMGDKGPLYEYCGLTVFWGLFQANSWLWSAVFHSRDTFWTERLDYFSAISLLGMSLMLCIIRTASLRVEAARVMVAAPIIAFTSTHILYLHMYTFDYGWNMVVCAAMGVTQLLLYTIWAAVVRHPAASLLWFCTFGTGAALLLEIFDFPPFWGVLDAHSLWHAATVPITFAWWAFLQRDAAWRTTILESKHPGGGRSQSAKKTQ